MTKAPASASASASAANRRPRLKRVPTKQHKDALDRAKSFMQSLPDFRENAFAKTIEKTHLGRDRERLPIPKHIQELIQRVTSEDKEEEIAKKKVIAKDEEIVTLKHKDDGREWTVKYKYKSTSFIGKWGDFTIDHDLKVGDAVVFNQMDGLVFNFHIFRAAPDEASTSTSTEARESTVSLRTELEEVKLKLEVTAQERDSLLAQVKNLSCAVKYNGESSVQDSLVMIRTLQRDLADVTEKLQVSSDKNTLLENELESRSKLVFEAEKLIKKLRNNILELKGNIRVFCRVRPPVPDDGESIQFSYPESMKDKGRGIHLLENGQWHKYAFDKVFDPKSGQSDIFVEVSELVQSAIDGNKVCIFAYGQTGSGKTYTMIGSSDPNAQEQKGIIPRAVEQIFKYLQSVKGWDYKIKISALEIYREEICDLLAPKSGEQKKCIVTHDEDGNAVVSHLTEKDVSGPRRCLSLLLKATERRCTGDTFMNSQSSRSHFVLSLKISGVSESSKVQGLLNLIDLAGNENLKESGASGDRLKESVAINKSLSTLTGVIQKLVQKDPHVPYRDSKLTHLLQPCLEGDSKTLMLVNVSPSSKSVHHTLNSLNFATRVNGCVIKTPKNKPRNASPLPSTTQRSKQAHSRCPLPKSLHKSAHGYTQKTAGGGKKDAASGEASSPSTSLFKTPQSRPICSRPPTIHIPLVHYAGG